MRSPSSAVTVLWAFTLLLAACNGNDGAADSTVTATPVASSTTASTTTGTVVTTTAASTATTGMPTTTVAPTTTTARTTTTMDVFYSIATHGLHPDEIPGSGGWFGSGCSPGGDTLPDGIWWGYITELSPSSITFDLACVRWADESDDDPVTEDFGWVIENNNPKVRVVPVRTDARVTDRWGNTPPQPSLPFSEWIDGDRVPHEDQGREDGIWLYVNDGAVTEVGVELFAG